MASTAVPQPTFGPAGFIVPAESDILAGVQEDIDAAFGGGLNSALETPQGQLASSQTAIIGSVNDTFLKYTNQVDPAFAEGRMQDAIARIYFIERNPSLPTVTQGLCTGLPGVVIPVGASAIASDGNFYTCTETGSIGAGGTITLPFACNKVGPIACPAGSLDTIYQAIPGWDTITNPSDGVLGNYVETRDAFETRRALSVAHNSIGSIPSILGAVLTVPDVVDALVIENASASAQSIGGATLAANSIYAAVLGGDSLAVATAIWSRKAPGCTYNGNTTVTVLDQNSGYVPPYPAYAVSYEIPLPLDILFSVVIVNSPGVPSDAATQIQNAIIGAFAGTDGGPRARIGTEVLASRYYQPIAALGSWAQIVSIEIGSNNLPSAVFVGSISGNTLTVSSVTSGTIAVGQTITNVAGAVATSTTIISMGSGSGGTGTYTVSNTQAVGSSTLTAAVPSLFKVGVNINQYPTVAATDIAVSLG